MKILGAIIASGLVLVAGSYTGNQANALNTNSTIRVTSVVTNEKRSNNDLLVAKKLLDKFGSTIGNAYQVCTTVAKGGIFGNGVDQCLTTYNFPKGKITAQGTRHTRDSYTFIVTGGSRRYNGAGGTVTGFINGLSPRRENLTFYLTTK